MTRFPVIRALNRTMTGGVREPFVWRWGWDGPDIVVIEGEKVVQSKVREPWTAMRSRVSTICTKAKAETHLSNLFRER